LPGQSEEFSAAIQRLINGGTLEDVNIAKRVAHTLKGAGNTVGVRGIATLTHNLEDILLALTKHNSLPTPTISKTLMNAADCLAVMSESLLGMGDAPDDAREVLQEVLDLANLIDRDGINATAGKDIENTNAATKPSDIGSVAEDQSQPSEPAGEPDDKESPVPVMRVPADFVDNLLRLVGESIIMTEQIRERIRLTMEEVKSMQSEYDLLHQLGGELEEIIDIKDLSKLHQQQITDSKFDPLEMDQYSELHTCSRRLVEASVDATELGQLIFNNLNRLGEMLISQAQLNNEIQEGVMRTRKVPAKSQFPRLQRCVRQASRLINKDVDIHLGGGETLMDSDTLNSLLDPLMHLLRNAVDHGIENSNDRIAAGKEPKGNIYLEFLRDGNNVLVSCRDDGRGLDYEGIRQTAVEKGMLNKEQVISEEELKHLILQPSFSTRSNTTQVSGRGIGMDAAYAKVMELSGFFQLNSETGQGCTIEIQLPQTLISSYALLAYVGPRLVAIANRGIEQIYYHEDGQLSDLGTEVTFQLGDSSYPVKPIESLLNIAIDRRSQGRTPRTIILVQTESGKTAVTVEKVVRSNDLVIKNLGHYIPKIPGILGITILGNGNVTPVLDLAELIRQSGSVKEMQTEYRNSNEDHKRLPTALVVDDSLSARRSLVQFMQDAGYKVRSARDGLEAMEILNVLDPDILLSDLEMPRMNGMELVNHVRASDDKSSLPIIIITSRTASKHQQEAIASGADVYLTKPYSEDELLEQIQKLQKPHN
jgi:chemosensory pili system protein ChpA (sensor histidine kinase/response regulator)